MSNTKHLTDLFKVCSVLPALLIMPAMGAEYTVKAGESLVVTEGHSNVESGGVFYNLGSLTIGDGLVFENNSTGSSTTKEYAAVIHMRNGAETIIGDNVVFSGGSALYDASLGGEPGMGGTIFSWAGDKDKVNIIEIGDNVAFRDNVAVEGSVIYTYGYNEITIGDNLVMENNHAMAGEGGGGAITINGYNGQDGSYFTNTLTVGKNALFQNNTTVLRAGALYVGGDKNSKAIFDDGARFIGNASSYGGAVSGFGLFEFGDVSFDSNISWNANEHVIKGWEENEDLRSEYVGNVANYVGNGGAVLNRGEFVINGNASFVNNYAEGLGGAIYNKGGNVIFNGDVVFSGNKDGVTVEIVEDAKSLNGFVLGAVSGGTPNDIYNEGTLTIASGMTSIDGGINGAGALDIKSGATLNMNYASIEQGTINIDGTLMASLANANDTVDISGIMSGSGDIVLTAATTGTYDISVFNDFIADRDADDVISFGKTYNVSIADGMATLTAKSASDIASSTGITNSAAGVISTFATSSDAKIQQVSLAIQEALNNGNTELVEKELGKLNPDSKPVTQSVAASVQGQVLTVASGRMSSVGGGATGRAGGDVTSAGVWAQGLINKSKLNGHFDGHTRGFALGADTLIDDVYTIGVGYAYSNTDIDTKSGDTSVESNSVFAYAQYKPANWYINATMNYTMSEYTDETNVMGYALDNQYDADAFGIQAMYGYDFASGITPELGMRYLHVSQDAHQNAGGNMIAEMNTNFLSVVSGVNYAFDIKSDTEIKFSPSLRAAMTYDVISENAIATVMVPGSSAYFVDVENLSRLGGEFGIGLTAEWRGLEMSLNYELDLHEDYTSQTGLLKFRYDF